MNPIFYIIDLALGLLSFALLVWIIMGWLISFRILNRSQPLVYRLYDALDRLFYPILKPIRRFMPDLGSVDISPIILWLLIQFLQYSIRYYSF